MTTEQKTRADAWRARLAEIDARLAALRASGGSALDRRRVGLERARLLRHKPAGASLALVQEARLARAMDEGALDSLADTTTEWMQTRGLALLMRTAEGKPCRCCGRCKVTAPDLKAIQLLLEPWNKAISLQLARVQARRGKTAKAEVVHLEWPSEGQKG